METSKKSTGDEWSDLPLYAEGTPVSLSAKQVLAKVRKIIATCGLGYDKPLASYDPSTQSLKMFEGIFPLGERPLLPILPPSGMTRNGALFQQPAWEPITGEIESSSWPTPTTQEVEHPNAILTPTGRRLSKNGKTSHSIGLADAVRMWPTPTTQDSKNNGSVSQMKRNTPPLNAAVAMWPTPTHGKLAGGQGAFNRVQDLYSEGTITDEERKAMQAGNGGKLNPRWVEWLMGFPDGWTDLEA